MLAIASAAWLMFWQPLPASEDVTVVIPQGSGTRKIATILREAGVARYPDLFVIAAELTADGRPLKAGKYIFPAGANTLDVLKILRAGRSVERRVTVPEGLTSRRIAGMLANELELDSTRFMSIVTNPAFARRFNIDAPTVEGYLFPETYTFSWGVTELDVAEAMLNEFMRQLPDSAAQKAEALGYSLHEIVTLASIIEGEAMLDRERPVISAVYHNRLRRGMRLEADPTIQFIIPDGPRRLLYVDLEIDSPYNTYRNPGLPPGPINNPGRGSIKAALNPANVPYVFMVAKGDGSHVFSETLAEHQKAHRAFNQLRREVARQQKEKQKEGNNK